MTGWDLLWAIYVLNFKFLSVDRRRCNMKKWGGLWLGVTQSHNSTMSPFNFNRNYVSILYRFRGTASYLSKVANFYLPHPHLVRDDPIGISPKCLESENHSPCAVWRCLRDPMFSRLTITPTCDGQTDRQTDRHRHATTACIARDQSSRGKSQPSCP